MTVDVKIHPAIKEFIVHSNKSETIVPGKDDWLWLILKQHLLTAPLWYKMVIPRECHLKIALLDAHSNQVYSNELGKVIHLNTQFRFYLDEKGQNVIARHLRSQFKACFHNFVQGAAFTNPEIRIKDAILEFCDLYEVSFNRINYDMLIKSWQRSDQRKKLQGEDTVCPLVF